MSKGFTLNIYQLVQRSEAETQRSFCFNGGISQHDKSQGASRQARVKLSELLQGLIFTDISENFVIRESHHWALQKKKAVTINFRQYFFGMSLVPRAQQRIKVVFTADFWEGFVNAVSQCKARTVAPFENKSFFMKRSLFLYKLCTTVPPHKYGNTVRM